MATRSERLGFAQTSVDGSPGRQTIYTCPADRVGLVKSLYVVSEGGAKTAYIEWLPSGGTIKKLWTFQLGDGTPQRLDPMWFVLHPGDSLILRINGAAAVTVQATAHGAELPSP